MTIAGHAVRSYRTFSPLPRLFCENCDSSQSLQNRRGGIFSVALSVEWPWGHPPRRYLAHCPAEFGLSSGRKTNRTRDHLVQLRVLRLYRRW